MRPDDILKEVLSDPNVGTFLSVNQENIRVAKMDIPSPDVNIEVIKAVIKGGYNGISPQQTFNEIKRIKKI